MVIRKIPPLFFILLISACGVNPEVIIEKVPDALDIIQNVYPIIKAVESDFQTAQAPPIGIYQPIEEYFVLASNPECQYVEDNYAPTIQTIGCKFGETIVQFGDYFTDNAAGDTLTKIANHSDIEWSSVDEWWDTKNPNVMLGQFLIYETKTGGAGIFWTVYGKSLSGWVYNPNGDQLAIRKFWEQTAAAHN